MKKNKGSAEFNKKAHWKAYKALQTRADKAWNKFRTHVKRNAASSVIIKDQRELLLILAECNYMARECMRMAGKGKKRK
jgi:hypothetical protein